MLVVENLSVNYGAIRALHQVSCRVKLGEIVALIGANGAGKTTILNTISGIVPSISGSVSFEGEEITRMRLPLLRELPRRCFSACDNSRHRSEMFLP